MSTVFHQEQCQNLLRILSKAMPNVRAVFHQDNCQMQGTLSSKCLSNAMPNVRAVFHQDNCQMQGTLSSKCFIKDNVKCQQCFTKSTVRYQTPNLLSILSKAVSNVRAVFHQEHCQIQDTISAKHFIKGNVKCQSSVSPRALSDTSTITAKHFIKGNVKCQSSVSPRALSNA